MRPWRLYAHEDCARCERAVQVLLAMWDHQELVLRFEDADDGSLHHHDAPALEDPDGRVVWDVAIDPAATRRAWKRWAEGLLAR